MVIFISSIWLRSQVPTYGDNDDNVAQRGTHTGQPMHAYAAYTTQELGEKVC